MSQQASHNEIMEGINHLAHRVDVIEERLAQGPSLHAEFSELREVVVDLRDDARETLRQLADVQEAVAETKGIIEAWAAVRTFGKFITWAAGIIGALAVSEWSRDL